ncbi:LysE family translocator [Chitinibacteraceae bacterium HSL-7]
MTLSTWLMFMSLAFAIIATPGPSAMLCLNHGARHGKKRALATVFGGVTAALTLMSASFIGLGAILAASTSFFLLVKLAGAAYLVWLGVRAWRASFAAPTEAARAPERQGGLFRQGYLVGISNPKDLLFFGALFPQFINPAVPGLPQFAELAVSWALLEIAIMGGYAFGGAKLLALFKSSRIFDRVTGSAMIAAGGALAAATRP